MFGPCDSVGLILLVLSFCESPSVAALKVPQGLQLTSVVNHRPEHSTAATASSTFVPKTPASSLSDVHEVGKEIKPQVARCACQWT